MGQDRLAWLRGAKGTRGREGVDERKRQQKCSQRSTVGSWAVVLVACRVSVYVHTSCLKGQEKINVASVACTGRFVVLVTVCCRAGGSTTVFSAGKERVRQKEEEADAKEGGEGE
jgi:hypothetical protein